MLFLLAQLVLVGGAIALGAYGISRAATAWSLGAAARWGALAGVNERSSHREPVPRIGGIGLVVGMMLGPVIALAMLAVGNNAPIPLLRPGGGDLWMVTPWMLVGLGVAVLLAFALGLWDDLRDPPAIAKLLLQILIAIVPPLMGLRLERIMLPGMADFVLLPPLVSLPLTAAWILLVMNAVNFMDGINGLAARFGQLIAPFTLAGIFVFAGTNLMVPIVMALFGAAEGFLRFNRTPARTFMGDCGSQPLGVYIACMGVLLTHLPTSLPLNFLGFLLIVLIFLFDVVYTLIRRTARGENPMRAHREHLYQRHLRATGEDHERTRAFVEGFIMTTGIAGAIFLYVGSRSGNGGMQILLLAVGAGAAVYYALRVRAIEKASAGRTAKE